MAGTIRYGHTNTKCLQTILQSCALLLALFPKYAPGSFVSSIISCLQLIPWTQAKEDQEPDAPCVRLDIEAVNRVVFEELKLSWDELDFIGIKKVC